MLRRWPMARTSVGLSIQSFVVISNVASRLVGDEKRGCAAYKGRRYRLNRQPLWGRVAGNSRSCVGLSVPDLAHLAPGPPHVVRSRRGLVRRVTPYHAVSYGFGPYNSVCAAPLA